MLYSEAMIDGPKLTANAKYLPFNCAPSNVYKILSARLFYKAVSQHGAAMPISFAFRETLGFI
jgi:hypothetical protein